MPVPVPVPVLVARVPVLVLALVLVLVERPHAMATAEPAALRFENTALQFPLLMVHRTATFIPQNWGYFLLDWCYAANIIMLIYLWSPLRQSPRVFTVAFSIAHGALPYAV